MGLFNKNAAITPARTVNLTKDASGAPAVNLTKVRDSGHLDLAKRADKAGIALAKRGLSGIRAQAMLILDHSGSMSGDYASGAVQTIVERALGFALQIDVDGVIPVIPFDSDILATVEVGVGPWPDRLRAVHDYRGVVNAAIWRKNRMGSTNLAAALRVVRNEAANATTPIYCAVVTDGEPNDRRATTEIVCDLSRYPVFLKFLAVKPVSYLSELDNLPDTARLLDNVNAQPPVGSTLNLLTCSDLEFADAMADEWDEWFGKAQKAGLLT
jgi:TerF-like vWA domain-containing protein